MDGDNAMVSAERDVSEHEGDRLFVVGMGFGVFANPQEVVESHIYEVGFGLL